MKPNYASIVLNSIGLLFLVLAGLAADLFRMPITTVLLVFGGVLCVTYGYLAYRGR